MALFLIQHGRSLPKDVDPDQGLSPEGISEVERIAAVAKGYGINVARIEHSGKARAGKTAEIYAAALEPEGGVHERSGLKPLDDVVAFSDTVKSDDNLMLVGHLPFMARLTSYLITGSVDTPVFKFQNGGIVCLDKDPEAGAWTILWTLMPTIG
ncbi:phosphohistidine phosphatase SixA [Thermodesulfobacteriota bacterium]